MVLLGLNFISDDTIIIALFAQSYKIRQLYKPENLTHLKNRADFGQNLPNIKARNTRQISSHHLETPITLSSLYA